MNTNLIVRKRGDAEIEPFPEQLIKQANKKMEMENTSKNPRQKYANRKM